MQIEYSLMQKEDVKNVALIESECFSKPWSEAAFERAVDDKNYIFMVARADGQIVGMAGLIVSFDEADITNVAVTESHRKNKIARGMLTTLMAHGEADGISAFTLEVRESNTPAIKLYESLGFECAGKRRDFYDLPKEDALIYWKR